MVQGVKSSQALHMLARAEQGAQQLHKTCSVLRSDEIIDPNQVGIYKGPAENSVKYPVNCISNLALRTTLFCLIGQSCQGSEHSAIQLDTQPPPAHGCQHLQHQVSCQQQKHGHTAICSC